jgi:hypothetical protein
VHCHFAILARLTAADKIFNIFLHSWLKPIMLYDFHGLAMTQIAGNIRVILYFADDFAQGVFCSDLQPVIIILGLVPVLSVCARIAVPCHIVGFLPFVIICDSHNYMVYQV